MLLRATVEIVPKEGASSRRRRLLMDAPPTEPRFRLSATPVRSLARSCALALFLGLLAFPWLVLGIFLVQHRDLPVAEVLAGGRGIAAGLVLIAGIAGTLWGRDAWNALDASLFCSQGLRHTTSPIASPAYLNGPLQLQTSRGRSGVTGSRPDPASDEATSEPMIVAGAELARECLGCGRVFAPARHRCPTCSQLLQRAPIPYAIPGRLRFDERIGIGGMAVVYRATDLGLGRAVAVKTLPRMSPAAGKRLHQEARAAAAVNHHGLASIWSVETWNGMPMIIQELLDGTLADRIVAGPLQPVEVIATGIAVAQALGALHRAGILHRDIKPSNIGFARSGEAKLLDFGIARVTSDLRHSASLRHPSTQELIASTTATSTTVTWMGSAAGSDGLATSGEQLVGTLSYLPPEALEGDSAGPSYDLWALAVVLWEALTGTNLFYGGRPDQLIQRILTAEVPDVRQRAAHCPAPLAAFFDRSLARDRAERPADGDAFAAELIAIRGQV